MKSIKTRAIIIAVLLIAVLVVGVIANSAYTSSLMDFARSWENDLEVSMTVSRSDMPTEVRMLREMQDELEDIEIPFWRSSDAQTVLEESVDVTIEGFLLFAIGEDDDAEAVLLIRQGEEKLAAFRELTE